MQLQKKIIPAEEIVCSHFLLAVSCVDQVRFCRFAIGLLSMKSSRAHYEANIVSQGDRILAKVAELPLLQVCAEFRAFCKLKKLSYMQVIHTDNVMTHPDNRGGLMLNPYNVHKNIARVCQIGANKRELHGAVAMEVSGQTDVKAKEIAANSSLVGASDGLLAPLTGAERVMSLGCGHMSGGCRAANHGCRIVCARLKFG
jgi:hypothetical protein